MKTINDEISSFLNKINKFGYDYNILEIRVSSCPNLNDSIMEVIMNKEFDYSNLKLMKKLFIFKKKLYMNYNIYVDFLNISEKIF